MNTSNSQSPADKSQSWEQVRAAFQKIWGYKDFRPPQGEIVRSVLARRDALIVLPTGGGKSICFQLPALLQTGLTLVVSPLVALMENQVQELRQRDLPAALLHSELSRSERKQTLQAMEQQQLRLLYLSPETLLSPPVWQRLRQPTVQVNGLILDEAHCLVQWGETFRPAYRRLGAVRPALLETKPIGTKIAIAAFTATADPQAQKTIRQVLQLHQPQIFRLSPYRPNLNLHIQRVCTPRSRRQGLLRFIRGYSQQAGLVYVRSRNDSEALSEWFHQKGFCTAAYHAGLSPEERRAIETDWLNNTIQFAVCTSAFGMGINKPDVRWVGHFHAPLLLSEYVQEIGRAGRDGDAAEALLMASEPTGWLDPADRQRQQFFEEKLRSQQRTAQQLACKLPRQGDIETVSRQFRDGAIALALLHSSGQLRWKDPFHYQIQTVPTRQQPFARTHAAKPMYEFIHTSQCRWEFLLHRFGFRPQSGTFRCGHCDNCLRAR